MNKRKNKQTIKMKVFLVSISLFTLLPLTGCWDTHDIQNWLYASAIGVDYSEEDNEFILYAKFLGLDSVAKSETAESKSENETTIGIARARSLNVAVNQLYSTSQQSLFWDHVSAVVLTESALKKGYKEVLDTLLRYREIRQNIYIYSTNIDMKKVFFAGPVHKQMPTTTLLHEPELTSRQRFFVKICYLKDFLANISEPGFTVLLPELTVTTETWSMIDQKKDMLRVNGVVPILEDKIYPYIDKDYLFGVRWMNKSTDRAEIPLPSRSDPQIVISVSNVKPKIRAYFVNNEPKFDVKIKARGVIVEMNENYNYDEIIHMTEGKIAENIRETFDFAIEQNVDIYSLAHQLYRQHVRYYQHWAQDDQTITAQSLGQIQVDFKLLSAGKFKLETLK